MWRGGGWVGDIGREKKGGRGWAGAKVGVVLGQRGTAHRGSGKGREGYLEAPQYPGKSLWQVTDASPKIIFYDDIHSRY